ncbi:MAG: ferritin [Chloroflexi bacterium]|nr:ferritin [Chloroflexota bacterium]
MARGDRKLIDALNQDLADELEAIIRYLWQHALAKGMESPELMDWFRKTSTHEMKHAYNLVERIAYLGGEPTVHPSPVKVGKELHEMLEIDLERENRAADQYRAHIKVAQESDDPATRRILEEFLMDEEEDIHYLESVLGK